MKVIIAGSRSITKYSYVLRAIRESNFEITEVVSGTANGVDRLGETYANLKQIPCERFPADWNNYGKYAGPRRNNEMAKYADALIAVWDGHSSGTKNMIELARKWGLKIFVYEVK